MSELTAIGTRLQFVTPVDSTGVGGGVGGGSEGSGTRARSSGAACEPQRVPVALPAAPQRHRHGRPGVEQIGNGAAIIGWTVIAASRGSRQRVEVAAQLIDLGGVAQQRLGHERRVCRGAI